MKFENKIICGDNMEVMATLPENCVDTIITDPPYGIGFMGKEWDTFNPEEVSKQKKRDTRSQKRRKLYGGRESDKPSAAMAAARYDNSRNAEYQQWFTLWAKEVLRIAKPGTMMLVFGGTRTFHRLTCAIEDAGWQIRDCMMWLYGSGFPKSLDISKAIDKSKGVERKSLGCIKGRGSNSGEGRYNWNNPNDLVDRTYYEATVPDTDLAKQWDGYGTALKPAWEPIIVAMKPLDGTFAQNAEKWGVGGLWIDGGRIAATENPEGNPQGRWPANVILDETAAAMVDEQSGVGKSNAAPRGGQGFHNCLGREDKPRADGNIIKGHNDSGGASRFFYCAKASRSERNAGLQGAEATLFSDEKEGMDAKQRDKSRKPENPGGNNPRNRGAKKVLNNHPTVKPLRLMEYLCRLTRTPAGGIVLDPFGGSGTMALACINTGRKYLLIEKEPHYCEIAKQRILQ